MRRVSLIDLHCHLLPGLDDGPPDLGLSLKMAEAAVADGIQIVACTPHILPGVHNNDGPAVIAAVHSLARELEKARISLALVTGADAHLAPDMLPGLRLGRIPTGRWHASKVKNVIDRAGR